MGFCTKKIKKSNRDFLRDGIKNGDWSRTTTKIDGKNTFTVIIGGAAVVLEVLKDATQVGTDAQTDKAKKLWEII